MANFINKLENWGETHHSHLLDVIRIILGITLFIKGISFMQDTKILEEILTKNGMNLIAFIGAHYIAMAHFVGGILITMGLLTRLAVAFQLPILLAAVFFVNKISSFSTINSEFFLSLIVFLLLIFFFISGSGHWSVDAYMKSHKVGESDTNE